MMIGNSFAVRLLVETTLNDFFYVIDLTVIRLGALLGRLNTSKIWRLFFCFLFFLLMMGIVI